MLVPTDVCNAAHAWVQVITYEVQPVWVHDRVMRLCVHWGMGYDIAAKKIAATISVLLGGLPLAATKTYPAKSKELHLPGPGGRHRRSKKHQNLSSYA